MTEDGGPRLERLEEVTGIVMLELLPWKGTEYNFNKIIKKDGH